MARKTAVAGTFYPAQKKELNKALKSMFSEATKAKRGAAAAILPHAGYAFSGKVMAHTLNHLDPKITTFIIIGVDHRSVCKATVSLEDFETPLGVVKNNSALATKLAGMGHIDINDDCHRQEHCIEVQLPGLQYLYKKFSIVPVLLGHGADVEWVARDVVRCIRESGEKIGVIASSDFTHHGGYYDYSIFSHNINANIHKIDKKAIGYILRQDQHGFSGFCEGVRATICGRKPIEALMDIAKKMHLTPKLVEYCTSADITGDESNIVGYAGIVFE